MICLKTDNTKIESALNKNFSMLCDWFHSRIHGHSCYK